MFMSYTIHYGPETPKFAPKKKGYAGLVGAVIIIMICSAAIGWSIPKQTELFVKALFPWTRTEVKAALADLRNEVRNGEPITDAVTTFCRELIYETDIP